MQIPDWLASLSGHELVRWHGPAPAETIAAVASRYPSALPEALLQLWRVSDGLELERFEATVLGASAVLALLQRKHWPAVAVGLLPVLDAGQSNFVALHVTRPLDPRLSCVPVDDGPRLLYRDLPSLFRELPVALATGACADEYFAGSAQGDYAPAAPRTATDQADAELLLQDGADEHLVQAVALLDASRIDVWARLLETQHFVRREVKARLQHLLEPRIVELLANDTAAFEQFAELAIRAARSAGLSVERRKGDALRANGKWYNLDALFHRRNVPDAFDKLSAWFAARANNGNPPPGGYLE
jgi:hypothetical protein